MVFEVKKKLAKGLTALRDDRLRLHVGIALVVIGLALFGMYFPKAMQGPQARQAAPADGQAQVAGANANATYNPNNKPTHAGAPAPGQHMADIPGSDPEACARGTGAGKASAPAGLEGTIDVSLPAGCVAGPYTLRTADRNEVQWAPLFGAFTFKDGSSFGGRGDSPYATVRLPFNSEGYKGAELSYTVAAKTTAKEGTYENALYVTDPAHNDGGYKVIIRVTVR